MFRFVSGVIVGIYIGSHYECRPQIKKIKEWIKTQAPPPKKF